MPDSPAVHGPDFVALQVRDPEASASFYEDALGLTRTPHSPPGAVVFDTKPISFAVRSALPNIDLAAGPAGNGVALWLLADDSEALHDSLADRGVEVVKGLGDSPFGQTFTFRDPDGYLITIHDKA